MAERAEKNQGTRGLVLSSRSNHEFWSIGKVRWSSRRWRRRQVRLVITCEVGEKLLSKRHPIGVRSGGGAIEVEEGVRWRY